MNSRGVQGNGASGEEPAISAGGRFVAFGSGASNLVAGDTNGAFDVFVRDRATGTTRRVSISSSGVQGDFGSFGPSISPHGRFVAFSSEASTLVPRDTNGSRIDVFVRNIRTGITWRVSVPSRGAQGAGGSAGAAISLGGRDVAFLSDARLVAGDTNRRTDVYLRDRWSGTTRRVSVSSGGVQANGGSFAKPAISLHGRYVAFVSGASNLVAGDNNGEVDVFVRDRATDTTRRVSVDSSGAQADGDSFHPSISVDGRYVGFNSNASNLVSGDTNGTDDVFVHDRSTGVTERISVSSSGAQTEEDGLGPELAPTISADGRYVAFHSWASNLVAGDTNGADDAFLRDRLTGTTQRVSVSSSGEQGGFDTRQYGASLSTNGRYVAFGSDASNMVAGDTNNTGDVFVRDLQPD